MGIISTQKFQFRLLAGEGQKTQLDLFQDEDIKLSNNVTGIFDVGVLPSDFTRQITLPGTKVNNAFFEHVYDISIDSPFLFATNIKVPAYFDFGGIYLSNGYLQLNKVNVIGNKFIDSYEVTIFGALSSFGRDVNRAYLTDLSTLSAFNHTASYANISASWAGNLFSGDIVYPLAEYGQKISYTPEEADFGIDSQYDGLCVQDFKPAIRVKKVWDAIFEFAGYTYSSSFWNQSWVNDVYMVCNNQLRYPIFGEANLETFGLFKISPFSGSNQTDWSPAASTDYLFPWYNIQSNPGGQMDGDLKYHLPYSSSLRGNIALNLEISGSGNAGGLGIVPQFYMKLVNTDTAAQTSVPLGTINNYFLNIQAYNGTSGTKTQKVTVQQQFNTGLLPSGSYNFKFYWSNSSGNGNVKVTLEPDNEIKSFLEVNKVSQLGSGWVMDIPSNMPYGTSGIKLVDFISGLQKKFNLVIYPNNTKPNEFIVETFNDWYTKGVVRDFNKYINLDDKFDIIPANNFAVNKLNFGDTLDQDYIAQQFSKEANREFGKIYYIDTTNFYSQGEFNVKTTFGNGPLIKIAGTGVSGSVGGINPPAPTSTAYVIGNAGWSSDYAACSNTYYYPLTVYAAESDPYAVTRLYTDAALTTGFDGNYSYWKWGFPYFYQKYSSYIEPDGTVTSIYAC